MGRPAAALSVVLGGVLAATAVGVGSASAGGGCGADVTFEAGATTVHSRHACWGPTVTQVSEGATVTFRNVEDMPHNITGPGPIGFHDFGADAVVRITFPTSGVFPYACTLHAGMAGAVVVGDPLATAPAASTAAAGATPAVSLSTTDTDVGSSFLGTTPGAVGTGVAVAGALGTGLLVVRRRRASLPVA